MVFLSILLYNFSTVKLYIILGSYSTVKLQPWFLDILVYSNIICVNIMCRISRISFIIYITSQGFMARAKGIPALELYRLAQKKKRKLVLCGHSLGGAVSLIHPFWNLKHCFIIV